ncbi:STAS domain-containing protein [Streptomyces sp. NPDC054842]
MNADAPVCRLERDCLVVEVCGVIDLDNQQAREQDLLRCTNRHVHGPVIIDLHTPCVTTSAVDVLLRLNDVLSAQGRTLTVLARSSLARRVFRITGTSRVLRVGATTASVRSMLRRCHRGTASRAE